MVARLGGIILNHEYVLAPDPPLVISWTKGAMRLCLLSDAAWVELHLA